MADLLSDARLFVPFAGPAIPENELVRIDEEGQIVEGSWLAIGITSAALTVPGGGSIVPGTEGVCVNGMRVARRAAASRLTVFALDDDHVPATSEVNDGPIELAVRFRVAVPGQVDAIRFYRTAGDTQSHTVRIYAATENVIATATSAPSDGTPGWEVVHFAAPVPVFPGAVYTASSHSPAGHYSATVEGFAGPAIVNGPLELVSDSDSTLQTYAGGEWRDRGNGTYSIGASAFPVDSYRSSNYAVDVVFTYDAVQPGPAGLLTGLAPEQRPAQFYTDEGQSVDLGTHFTPTADVMVHGVRVYYGAFAEGPATVSLWTPGGALLAQADGPRGLGAAWREVLFPAPVRLTAGATHVVSVRYPASASYGAVPNFHAAPVVRGVISFPAGAARYTYSTDPAPVLPTTASNTSYLVDPLYVLA